MHAYVCVCVCVRAPCARVHASCTARCLLVEKVGISSLMRLVCVVWGFKRFVSTSFVGRFFPPSFFKSWVSKRVLVLFYSFVGSLFLFDRLQPAAQAKCSYLQRNAIVGALAQYFSVFTCGFSSFGCVVDGSRLC